MNERKTMVYERGRFFCRQLHKNDVFERGSMNGAASYERGDFGKGDL
jgi:hypothetical protein